jgi:hypothetical protein
MMIRLFLTLMLIPFMSFAAFGETDPLNLVEPSGLTIQNQPLDISPAFEPPANEETNPISPNAPVIIGEINDVKPESLGLIDETQNGFPFEAWKGTSYTTIHKVLAGIPARLPSRTLYTLSRKLLLSSLEIPAADNSSFHENLLVIRAVKLADMGNMKEAFKLLENLRTAQNNPKAQKIRCSFFLGIGDIDQAYAIAKEQISQSSDVFWEKTMIVCQVLKKEMDQALLSLSLFDEKYAQKERAFIDVVRAQLDPAHSFDQKLLSQTNFDLPLFVLLNHQGFTLEIINALSPLQQDLILTHFNPLNASPDDRLKLVEYAARLGSISAEELEKSYEYYLQGNPFKIRLSETLPESAAKIIEGSIPAAAHENSSSKRIYYYGQSKYGKSPQEKFEGLILLLENAFHTNLSGGILKTMEPLLESLEPRPLSSSIAGLLTKAFAALGRKDLIAKWHTYLTTDIIHTSVPLLIIYDEAIPHETKQNLLKAWYHKILEQRPDHAAQIAGKVYSILASLGIPISPSLWEDLPSSPPAPAVHLPYDQQALLKDASHHQRVAETIARLLIASNPEAQTFNAENLPLLLKALLDAGLRDEAKSLATDYLIELEQKELGSS